MKLTTTLRPLAAIATGVGMAALFPPFGAGQWVWVVLLPLLIALWSLGAKWRRRKSVALGFLTGVTFFLINLSWLRTVSDAGWIALSLYLACFPAAWAWFTATLGNPWRTRENVVAMPGADPSRWRASLRSLRFAFACAAVWTGLEWLRGWLFTGFGWNTLGIAFHETPIIAQSADLLGATGLSLLPVFFQAVIAQAARRIATGARDGKIRPHFDFAVAALMVALATSYGIVRLAGTGKGEGIPLRALMVQLNIPQEASRQLWSATEIHIGYEDETLAGLEAVLEEDQQRLAQAMEEGNEGGLQLRTPDWIVWPETALTGWIFRTDTGRWGTDRENHETLSRVHGQGDFTIVTGVTEVESEDSPDGPMMKRDARRWNTLATLSPQGELAMFRKRHLVIFGEYIPFVEQLPFLARIYEQQAGAPYTGAFSVGESLEPMTVKLRGEDIGIIPSVCFEDTVARLLRKFVRGGPQVIVNVTNDGWFKESPGALQHFANARFRAIELRRPMLRCANQGVTAAITATGMTVNPATGRNQVLADESGSPFTRGHLLAELEVPRHPPITLYAIIGDWGVIVLALVGLFAGSRLPRPG